MGVPLAKPMVTRVPPAGPRTCAPASAGRCSPPTLASPAHSSRRSTVSTPLAAVVNPGSSHKPLHDNDRQRLDDRTGWLEVDAVSGEREELRRPVEEIHDELGATCRRLRYRIVAPEQLS
jgi:hypothetical protein